MGRRWIGAMLAAMGLVLAASPSRGDTLVVDDDGADCAGAAYQSIGGALRAAGNNDAIIICAGTYAEQVVLTKSLRLTGVGEPVIRPNALPVSRPSAIGGRPVTAGILVDAPRAVISGIDVDMSNANVGTCSPLLAGIYFLNASGALNNVHVSGVRVVGNPGCDSGVGLYVESGMASDRFGPGVVGKAKLKVRATDFSDCQKGGVAGNGLGTNIKMRGGQISGDGPGAPVVQNGIQIAFGAKGKVSDVEIHGLATSVASKTATGVLMYNAGRAAIRGVKIDAAQTGIFVIGNGLVQGSKLADLVSDGIVLFGNNNHLFGNSIDGAGVSGVFVNGDNNVVRFGFLGHTPIGLWFHNGLGNDYSGVTFDESTPLDGRGVYGGLRDLDESWTQPLQTLCRTSADCDDGDPCTVEICDAETGTCSTSASTASTCDDNNACTDDVCSAGVCQSTARPDGTPCPDDTVCNGAETCQAGACTAGTDLDCDDNNPCTTDSCNPLSGCSHTPLPDGSSCADTTVCNGAETCVGLVCTPGTMLDCDDTDPCTTDSCDPVTGCANTARPDGSSCADTTVCNGAETCQGALCTPGTPLDCDDGDPCTTDSCNPLSGCLNVPVPLPCP